MRGLFPIFLFALPLYGVERIDMRLFDEGALGRVHETAEDFEFSIDGSAIWFAGEKGGTNCYAMSDLRRLEPLEAEKKAPPNERLYWRQRWQKRFSETARCLAPNTWTRETADPHRSEDGVPEIINQDRMLEVQLYPDGRPAVAFPLRLDGRDSWVLCKTDFVRFSVSSVYTNVCGYHEFYCYSPGCNCVVGDTLAIPVEDRYLMFHSGRYDALDEGFSRGSVRFSKSDFDAMTGSDLVHLSVSFLSASKVAVLASSIGRNSFFGRSFLMIYDFNRKGFVWSRKTRTQFSKYCGMIWPGNAVLSADERYLAVRVAEWVYLYDLSKELQVGR